LEGENIAMTGTPKLRIMSIFFAPIPSLADLRLVIFILTIAMYLSSLHTQMNVITNPPQHLLECYRALLASFACPVAHWLRLRISPQYSSNHSWLASRFYSCVVHHLDGKITFDVPRGNDYLINCCCDYSLDHPDAPSQQQ